jgi:amino acid transporter
VPPMPLHLNRRLNLIPLIGVIFFIVCGGAYGLEPLVGAVGPGWAILLVLVTPLFWSLPIALMVAELSSSIPAEGGYYVWVRQALGEFWGVQGGWWAICYMMVDLAVYPVLFVSYLASFVPSLRFAEDGSGSLRTFLFRWLVACAVIALAFLINWRGARAVGHSSALNLLLVLLPFMAIVIGALYFQGAFGRSVSAVVTDLARKPEQGLLTLGLSTILWNYMGWDDVSTFAGEVNNPQRNYPRAIAAAMLLTIGIYSIPLFFGFSVTTDPELWTETRGWPDIATLIGGSKFGLMVAAGALLSTWALFNGQLLYVSRLPYAMALDNWLPAPLKVVSTRTGAPIVSVIVVCCVASLCSALPFGKLIVIDVLLYSSVLLLEFISLLVLRLKQPQMPRPFRVPGGWIVLIAITLAPMSCAAILLITLFAGDPRQGYQLAAVIIAILTGIVLYAIRRKKRLAETSLRRLDFVVRE